MLPLSGHTYLILVVIVGNQCENLMSETQGEKYFSEKTRLGGVKCLVRNRAEIRTANFQVQYLSA